MQLEDGSRYQDDASTSHGIPEIASNPQEARQRCGTDGQSSEGTNPADTSISGTVRQYIIVI